MKRLIGVTCFCLMFWSTEAQDPGRYDVVLHEIFADPTPSRGLPASEFIEIRNRSAVALNLKNWMIKTGTSTAKISTSYVLLPDSMVILCGTSAVASFQPFGSTIGVTSFPSLNNEGDSLLLFSPTGKLIHGLVWNKDWYQNALKEEGGWSLEMKDIELPCETLYNWAASVDPKGGTPGKMNSIKEKLTSPPLPQLLYSYIKGKQELFLQFSKSVDGSMGSISILPTLSLGKIEEVPPLYNALLIKLSSPADTSMIYQVTTTNIKSCNAIALPVKTIRSGVLQHPSNKAIVINEALFNPPVGGSDFIELYNKSNQIIDAQYLYLANRNTDGKIASITPIQPTPYPFFPGTYISVSPDPEWTKAKFLPPDSALFFKTSLPSYPNDNGSMIVLDEQGTILDELAYDEKWHFQLLSNKEGVSLERLNPFSPTQQASNWHSAAGSAGYATPSYRNSQVLNVMETNAYFSLNTKIISPDNDGRDDYLRLHYTFPEAGFVTTIRVYDISGREVTKMANNILCGTNGDFRWDGNTSAGNPVHHGFYILYVEAFNRKGDVLKYKESVAVYGN